MRRLVLALLITLISFKILTSSLFLTEVGTLLSKNDQPKKNADAVIVLLGEPTIRPKFAARAVLDGYANKLMVADCETNDLETAGLIPSETEISKMFALKEGLNESQIIQIIDGKRVTSTVEEGQAIKAYLLSNHPEAKRIIIVTSWFHTRRASWILKKVFEDSGIELEMMPIPEVPFRVDNWWRSERGLITVVVEYIKSLRYAVLFAGRKVE